MAYWLTRDEGARSRYEIWSAKPKISPGGVYYLGGKQLEIPSEKFHRISITRLKPGEIRRVKSINIELED